MCAPRPHLRALYGGARAYHISHERLTLWRSSLSDSRSSWRRRILSWKIQHIVSCHTRAHFTSTALVGRRGYLQPGESTQVGAVLDVNVGGAASAAAVGVLGSLRHAGHCRCFVSLAVGATLPVGHRSTSESACGRRPRSACVPPRAAPPARTPGRLAGWSSRIVLPPPLTPLSAFYRHAWSDARRGSLLFVLPKNLAKPFSPKTVRCALCRALADASSGGVCGRYGALLQPLPGRFLSVPGSSRDTEMPPNCWT